MLLDNLGLDLFVKADDEEYSFSGDLTPEYKKIINAIKKAEELQITLSYWYEWHLNHRFLSIAPEALSELFKEAPEEILEDASYAYLEYDYSDISNDRGQLYAFRIKDGIVQKGEVELKEVSELPDNTSWHAPMATIVVEDEIPGIDKDKFTQIAKELLTMSQHAEYENTKDDDYLSLNENKIDFEVKYPELKSPDEVHRYATLAWELYQVLNSNNSEREPHDVPVEFFSEDNREPRMLSIDVTGKDGYKMYMASLD